ncbi:MAG: CbbQ/NirQ/NorQ/GpvN family protein, partial [Candidatus Tectomicrobia bacterium]|nr:CbbQ/NirQ/NorQ/GpvN family protein [Candidatus Tectomicrobia bacterium]
CYLDEIVEARKDTTVVIHPLTDDRRILPIEKRGQVIKAPDTFMMVLSFNPGYQSVLKDLKQSTKQRFIAIEFHYPPEDLECQVVEHESQVDHQTALVLVKIANKVRNLKEHGLEEGVSTRLLIYAGKLVSKGIDFHEACEVAITKSLTDDADMQRAIREVISDYV